MHSVHYLGTTETEFLVPFSGRLRESRNFVRIGLLLANAYGVSIVKRRWELSFPPFYARGTKEGYYCHAVRQTLMLETVRHRLRCP